MKKRFVVIMAIMLILSSVLTGCGSGNTGEAGESKSDYPNSPIEVVIRWGTGGGSDTCARTVASIASKYIGETIICTNVSGSGGGLGMVEYNNRKADGYSLVDINSDTLINTALGTYKYGYEILEPIACAQIVDSWMVCGKDKPYSTWEEFVTYAKENPGKLSFGGAGMGSNEAFACEKLKAMEVNTKYVSYDSTGDLMAATLRGEIDICFITCIDTLTYVKDGSMKALGVCSDERFAAWDTVPTLTELGYEISLPMFRGVAIKKGVDPAVKEIIIDAYSKALHDDKWLEFCEERGLDAEGSFLVGDDFGVFLDKLYKDYEEIIKETGYKGV